MKTSDLIKKLAISAAIAVPCAFALAPTAKADPLNPWSIQVGGNVLTDGFSRDVTSSGGFHAGVSYEFASKSSLYGTPAVDFDYDYNSGHGNTANTYGLYLADRYGLSRGITGGAFRPYIGAGIGANVIDGNGNGGSNTVTNFGGKVMIGGNFNQTFVEIAYQITGKNQGYDASNVNFNVGLHF